MDVIFHSQSLKTRVTLFTLGIFVISIWSLAFYSSRMLRTDLQRMVGEQQLSMASIMAAQINQDMDDRLRALEKIAGGITPAMLSDTETLQKYLEHHPVFQSLFNGGTFVTGIDGTAIADVPISTGRIGTNHSDRAWMINALKGKSTIGKPSIGRKLHVPIFSMAAPIINAQGKVIGALAGVTDMSKPSFLDKVTQNRYGKTGGFMLIAPQYRLIVTASDTSQIMQPLPAPGINLLLERYLQGFEGSGRTIDSHGVDILSSAKQIPIAGWFLTARMPAKEALATIRTMLQRILIVTIGLTLLSGVLTWWMLRRQLSPMLVAVKTLANLSDTDQPPHPLPIFRQDEIGQLIGGFNRLLETLGQREEALKDSESKFRVVFERSPAMIILTTVSDGIICEVNRTCLETLGYMREELLGKSTLDVGVWVDPPARTVFTETLKQQGYLHEMAAVLKSKDGTELNVLISAELVEIDGIKYSLSVVQDITEREKMETQLLRHQKMESIGQLVGGIAHDFNNMLTPIYIYAEMIQKNFSEEDTTHKYAASILNAAGKSKDLIKQLLSFSSKQTLDKQVHDLNNIINNFSKILNATIRESIRINKNLCSDSCPVKIDTSQIEQILLNLAVNAQDAIGTNGDLTIETGRVFLDDEYCKIHPGSKPGQYVMLAFNDSGCGMDNSVLSRIFEPFYTTKGVGHGTGLGLSTVFGIVKQHEGYIDVMSKPGSGTTFHIYLPLSDTTDIQEDRSEAIRTGHAKAVKNATILVVEDNEMVRDMTCELLQSNGYTVVSAHLPEEAINIARNHSGRVDLLLTDVVMPQMNGPELYSRLKEIMPDLPVLYMSGYAGDATAHDSALTENINFIAKPFVAEKLLTEVLKAIES